MGACAPPPAVRPPWAAPGSSRPLSAPDGSATAGQGGVEHLRQPGAHGGRGRGERLDGGPRRAAVHARGARSGGPRGFPDRMGRRDGSDEARRQHLAVSASYGAGGRSLPLGVTLDPADALPQPFSGGHAPLPALGREVLLRLDFTPPLG